VLGVVHLALVAPQPGGGDFRRFYAMTVRLLA